MATPVLLAEHGGASVYHASHEALAEVVRALGGADAHIVDAPYSERTHKGHDAGTATTSKVWQRSNGKFDVPAQRRSLTYSPWTEDLVRLFVEVWSPITRGWLVSITDDVLAPVWQREMERAGRYAFAPLPYVAPGSRVRLTGDGPSGWTTWVVVARPRTKEMARWGTLPGAYVLPPGMSADLPVVGGKPPWLMQRLVEDYSRPGDLVVDPCCGAGTTLIGALRSGRRAIGGDALREHADLGALWIRHPHRDAPALEKPATERPQRSLFDTRSAG